MSVKKYKFVSPGVFVSEIDNSQLPELETAAGPVIIGRAQRGPGLRPVQINSFAEFVNVFGDPTSVGTQTDAWRAGDNSAPLYAVYAAQAWLRNNSPITFVRLLGDEDPNKASGGEAGWYTRETAGTFNGVAEDGGGAYGLFIMPSASNLITNGSSLTAGPEATGSLAAIWYFNKGYIGLSGTYAGANPDATDDASGATHTSSVGTVMNSVSGEKSFTCEIFDESQNVVEKLTFSLDRTSDRFIRNVFNTSPTKTWSRVSSTTKNYFLGETFERHYYEGFKLDKVRQASTVGAIGVILPLKLSDATSEKADNRKASQAAQTGWVISQDLAIINGSTLTSPVANSFSPEKMQQLFKFHALDTGQWDIKNLKISIANIQPPTNTVDAYGTLFDSVEKN